MLDALLILSSTFYLSSVCVVGARGGRYPWSIAGIGVAVGGVALAAMTASWLATAVALAACAVASSIGLCMFAFHMAGRLVRTFQVLFTVAFAGWAIHYLWHLDASGTTRLLLWSAVPLMVIVTPLMLVRAFEDWDVLLRRTWRRPRVAGPAVIASAHRPLVSIHVPTHAEPPHVVIATLNALDSLDYPNFEVIVLDNNTEDPELWRPVEAHCQRLGERFRFVHVEGVVGAKAGALNLALDHYTHPRAELIAVVDADYQAEPDFLRDTVGFFTDERLGFVQTPHAYRGWENSRFLRMANWEYAYFFANGMVSLNERGAAITVGTMCVIRRDALLRAGRWATWCLTEDSELAIRIHALGYRSLYLSRTYGRGLIPDTYAGYATQRFRWTFGPTQEFRHHWRTLVGIEPSQLTWAQRIHHTVHGLFAVPFAAVVASVPLVVLLAVSMLLHGERLPLPMPMWAAATATLAVTWLHRWIAYRQMGARPREFVGGVIAGLGLVPTILTASFASMIRRDARWRRTNKFRHRSRGLAVLATARAEIYAAGALGVTSAVLLAAGGSGISGFLAIGLAIHAVTMAFAPALALVADADLRERSEAAEAPVDARALAHAVS